MPHAAHNITKTESATTSKNINRNRNTLENGQLKKHLTSRNSLKKKNLRGLRMLDTPTQSYANDGVMLVPGNFKMAQKVKNRLTCGRKTCSGWLGS
jgi:hypothetical protein